MNSTIRSAFENMGKFNLDDICCYCRPQVQAIGHEIMERSLRNSCESNERVNHAIDRMKNKEQNLIRAEERIAELECIIKELMKELKGE